MTTVLNLNALPDYIEQNRDELFVKSIAGFKTLDYIEIMPNVKYKEALNYLDSEVVLQAAACGWNPQGSDTFAQRYIEVHPVEVEKEWCYLDFQKKYMNYQLNFEAGRESLPFEQKLADSNVNAIKMAVEDLVWKGDSGLSITGFLADAEEASATTVDFASGATAVEKVDSMVAALPVAMLKKGVNIFMSYTDFRAYIQASNGTCCANRPIIDAAVEELAYLGDSRVKLIPVMGLEGTDTMVAATADALVYGTDIEGSESVYRIWWEEKDQKFCFRVLFNAGTAIKFPNEVIVGK